MLGLHLSTSIMPKVGKKMATEDRLQDALLLLKHAQPEQVEIVDLPDGSMKIVFIPSGKKQNQAEKRVYGAEERNRLIREMEKRFAGRGEEDSEEWIRMIKKSHGFSKPRIEDFS